MDPLAEVDVRIFIGVLELFMDSLSLMSHTLRKHNHWERLDPKTLGLCTRDVISGKLGRLMSHTFEMIFDGKVFPQKDVELQTFIDLLSRKLANEPREPPLRDIEEVIEHLLDEHHLMIFGATVPSLLDNRQFCVCSTCKRVLNGAPQAPVTTGHPLVIALMDAMTLALRT